MTARSICHKIEVAPELNVVANRGYFNSQEILKCQEAGITTYVPKPMTSGAKADGKFDKTDFIFKISIPSHLENLFNTIDCCGYGQALMELNVPIGRIFVF